MKKWNWREGNSLLIKQMEIQKFGNMTKIESVVQYELETYSDLIKSALTADLKHVYVSWQYCPLF